MRQQQKSNTLTRLGVVTPAARETGVALRAIKYAQGRCNIDMVPPDAVAALGVAANALDKALMIMKRGA